MKSLYQPNRMCYMSLETTQQITLNTVRGTDVYYCRYRGGSCLYREEWVQVPVQGHRVPVQGGECVQKVPVQGGRGGRWRRCNICLYKGQQVSDVVLTLLRMKLCII